MKVIDLDEHNKPLYFACLEDWSPEMNDAGGRKARWYGQMKEKGLRVKLAMDDSGNVGGMIHYVPIEHSYVRGKGLYFIYCIWVHGHKEGRGNFQGRGLGSMLLDAAEEDARRSGAEGIAAWGLCLPFWMKASWFRKHGYRRADRDGIALLVWKAFTDTASPPAWPVPVKKPGLVPGKVAVTSFVNGWCPAQNIAYERAKRAAAEIGDRVEFREVDTLDRGNLDEWGIVDALFIDGKAVRTGPPPTFESIKKKIAKRAERLGK